MPTSPEVDVVRPPLQTTDEELSITSHLMPVVDIESMPLPFVDPLFPVPFPTPNVVSTVDPVPPPLHIDLVAVPPQQGPIEGSTLPARRM